ncbi:MAG: hypothetical protein IT379_42555 [Deltaproteobacteria bacterium]|nr:hypothetical protein [Deltaproteobacteria bacterium]
MSRSSVLVTLAMLVLGAGCDTDPTELVVVVEADEEVAARLTAVRLAARAPDGSRRHGERTITLGAELGPPVRFVLRASEGRESSQIEIVVEGLAGSTPFVRRIVRARYVPESIGLVRVRLTAACIEQCDDTEDCDEGTCGAPREVPAERVDRGEIPRAGRPRDAALDVGGEADARGETGPERDADVDAGDLGADGAPLDSGADVGPRDAGPFDATMPDASVADASDGDGGGLDGGPRDTGPRDLGSGDVGTTDGGSVDLGPADTSIPDAGPLDTGPIDMGCVMSGVETCNGRDDDCDGTIDNIAASACTTGMPGICASGVTQCVSSTPTCVPLSAPRAESCNAMDDDCNLLVDDPVDARLDCPAGRICRAGACVGVIDLAGGTWHSCAVLATGATWCWGVNTLGELGTGTAGGFLDVPQATAVPMGGFSAVTAGNRHTCGLTPTGEVYCWGDNELSQLAMFAGAMSATPVRITLPGAATAVAAGRDHTCVIVGGDVYCWGANDFHQTGYADTVPSPPLATPWEVVQPSPAIGLALGTSHSCAVLASGEVTCWGSSVNGQAGQSMVPRRWQALPVEGITDAVSASAGHGHSCALHATGRISCWGSDTAGQRGDGGGFGTASPTPTMVSGIDDARLVAAGGDHTCTVRAGGATACWGASGRGATGLGSTTPDRDVPTATLLGPTERMVAGTDHTCAALLDGTLWCFGANDYGALGDDASGIGVVRATPVRVVGLP